MKIKRFFQLSLLAAFAASCVAEQQEAPQAVLSEGEEITAGIAAPATRTYVEDVNVLWGEGDCLSVFPGRNVNSKYILKSEPGKSSGTFTKVFGALVGKALPGYAAAYPYAEDVTIDEDGTFTLTLPSEQKYAENSFGPGANTMVAWSGGGHLQFSNVGGFFVLTLKGNVAVNSVELKATGGEPIAGVAQVNGDGVTFAEDAEVSDAIVLTCEEPVQLDREEVTSFWIVVPPTVFSEGFKVTVNYNDGEVFEQEMTGEVGIERNKVWRTDPLSIIKKELTVKRLWGKYPTEWPTFAQNLDRCATMDEDYIYVAQQGSGQKGVWAIPLDGTISQATQVCMDGVESAGTHYTSCVRTIWDPAKKKHILLLCNLALNGGDHLYLYAYENGIDAAPTKLLSDYTLPTWAERRFGDFFTVVGDWSKGAVWFRTNTTGASTTARWNIENGKLKSQTPDGFNYGYGASQGKGSLYQYDMNAKTALLVTDKIGMFYDLNSTEGVAWNNIANEAMKNLFGFTPFEYEGEKYIAFLKMYNAARSWVTIIKDSGDFKADLETYVKTGENIVYQAAVQIDEEGQSTKVMPDATYSDQTSANCTAVVKEDGVYIMGHHHNVGLSVFKMSME
ncbi:MAG: hypothetical protein IJ654_01540 [Bacteroidales bacterium]|nr:hypothetical protein [Bacteroidales bacterium]